ncbi:hypothetical protein LOK49_LG04G00125 [Camellia lanceoleosa]|uniref:Uncharacterized protein n=1 Tax=Camellia lanceoleosa TaxID=1840588 RepID=A0ACC0I2F0_9ERIC|nr:hypothetical protein LOK49_LG04G00125 [Camellia lanceoleosa]
MPVEALELNDSKGHTALNTAARFGNTDAAKILVAKHSDLLYIRNEDDWLPLHRAAQSAHKDTLSYLLMVTNPDCKTKKPIENDLEHTAPFEDDSGVELLVRVIASGFYVPPIKHIQHIRELKLKHNQAVKLVKCLCEQVRSLEDLEAYRSLARNPLLVAAKLGIHEIIEEIVNSFPEAIFARNADDLYIFELAVIKRHENVFNLLYQLGEDKQYFARSIDNEGNTLLHLVGNKAPIEKLNVVPGAALQMQRELQWFKEVEKFVSPSYIDEQNDDGETPSTVFTNKHMDLVVEGEKWMKNRATSCTIAATLITITAVVFAAAMTVPGGNNNTSGLPIFSAEKAFIIFVVSMQLPYSCPPLLF